jgi:hypothetical protein
MVSGDREMWLTTTAGYIHCHGYMIPQQTIVSFDIHMIQDNNDTAGHVVSYFIYIISQTNYMCEYIRALICNQI